MPLQQCWPSQATKVVSKSTGFGCATMLAANIGTENMGTCNLVRIRLPIGPVMATKRHMCVHMSVHRVCDSNPEIRTWQHHVGLQQDGVKHHIVLVQHPAQARKIASSVRGSIWRLQHFSNGFVPSAVALLATTHSVWLQDTVVLMEKGGCGPS